MMNTGMLLYLILIERGVEHSTAADLTSIVFIGALIILLLKPAYGSYKQIHKVVTADD